MKRIYNYQTYSCFQKTKLSKKIMIYKLHTYVYFYQFIYDL